MHAQQVDPNQPDIIVKIYTEALARATDCKLFFILKNNTMTNVIFFSRFHFSECYIHNSIVNISPLFESIIKDYKYN